MIGLEEKDLEVKFKYRSDCLKLKKSIIAAQKTLSELNRSVYGTLRYDVSWLISENWKQKIDQFLKMVANRYSYAKTLSDFTKEYTRLVAEFGFICDACYSFKPFHATVFQTLVVKFISIIRAKLQKMWNDNFRSIGAGDCLAISDASAMFIAALTKWNIKEDGFSAYYRPVVLRFTQSLFTNSREIICNIMDGIYKTDNEVKGKLKLNIFDNFEGHLFFVIDHFTKFPSLFFLQEITSYVSNILAIFFNRIDAVVKESPENGRLFVALMNSNMLRILKNVERKIIEMSSKQMTIAHFRTKIFQEYLILKIGKIFKSCWSQLRKFFKNIIVKPRFTNITDFLELDFRKKIDKIIFDSNSLLSLLINITQFKEFFQYIFISTFKKYVKTYFQHLPKFSSREFIISTAKVKSDFSYFQNFCIDDILENCYIMNKHLNSFADSLQSTNVEFIIVGFINLQVCFPKIFNQKNISRIIKFRMNDEKNVRNYVKSHIEGEKNEIPRYESNMMFDLKKKSRISFMKAASIMYFILILSEIKR